MVGLHRADREVHDDVDVDLGGGPTPHTAFERIGGAAAFTLVVEQFFDRVLADPQLSRFFLGGDHQPQTGTGGAGRQGAAKEIDMVALQRLFGQLVAGQLGAQLHYEGRNLTQAHRGLRISSDDYDRMSAMFVDTLWDNQVPEDILLVAAEKLAALKPLIVEVFRPACVAG
jgi:hemoglobin